MDFDRRFLLVGTACLVGFGGAKAQNVGDASAVVKTLQDGMIDVLRRASELSLRQRFDALRPAIGASFDLTAMARTCYGPGWDGLTEAQRDQWSQAFGDYVAATYAARFEGFNGKGFEPNGNAVLRGGDTVVTSRVILADGPPMPIDYVVRQTPQGWRIGDILANGSISELAQWRHSLRGLASGGDFAAALATLRKRQESLLTP